MEEPEAINTLVAEAQSLKDQISRLFKGQIPSRVEGVFSDMSRFFEEQVLSEWRKAERFDELIDYILYQHEEHGGDDLWPQVLLDLRQRRDEARAVKLLDGLFRARAENYWISFKNHKKHPDNHFCAADLAIRKADVMKVLYEHAFILENKKPENQDLQAIEEIRNKIWAIEKGRRSPNEPVPPSAGGPAG